ncbi:MAG: hypothetical protein JKY26_08975 [Pseudomonas sp.]|nr:hypothetical protein [Pseudomonas sp.]PHR10899.1 MAG: hypothetical protein COA41_20545 [Sphingopyxis sp.]
MNAATKAPLFVPFETNRAGDSLSVIGHRADADYLELMNEADLRHHAALQLLDVLSTQENLTELSNRELGGCFLAVKYLVADANALYSGTYKCWQQEREGRGGQ